MLLLLFCLIFSAGWGRDRQWGYDSAILRMVEMPVWKLEECRRIYDLFAPNRIMSSMNICAGDGRKNKDACIVRFSNAKLFIPLKMIKMSMKMKRATVVDR